jgi:Cytochrome c554 and c-prime
MSTEMLQLCAVARKGRSVASPNRHKRKISSAALFFGILLPTVTLPLPSLAQAHRATSPTTEKKPPTREAYVGDQACRSCHEAEFNSYQATAHHLTSSVADAHSIAGNFAAGANLFKTANPSLYFKMTADANGFYQTAVDEVSPGKNVQLTERLDIVVGVRKSQTYLYWKDDGLFELPVSWWGGNNQWINSPGYEDGAVRFDRPIYPRCLECHGSYFKSLAPPPNKYDPASLVLGIECERCHGPGREHVALYSSPTPPKAGTGKAIVNPASLPRNRQIDTCALCHGGLGNTVQPALSFQPGDALEKYLQLPDTEQDLAVDVHGNQVELLRKSRCFHSSNMTCVTCHNVHQVQRDAASFSKSCLNCHKAQQCGKFATMGAQIVNNCIDCHMPLRESQALFSNSNNQMIQLPVRDHDIAIYADSPSPAQHHSNTAP